MLPAIGGTATYTMKDRPGEEVRIPVPPILDADRHRQLLDALDASSTGPRKAYRTYPLTERLFGLCGMHYHGFWRADRHQRRYRCGNARYGKDQGPRCSDKQLDADDVDFVV